MMLSSYMSWVRLTYEVNVRTARNLVRGRLVVRRM